MADNLPQKIEQTCAEYEVTAAGQRLLAVVVQPEARTMTVTRKCQLAGISSPTYYHLFNDDERFKAAYRDLCQAILLSAAAPASQSLGAAASAGDANAAKLVLEMAGVYQPTARVEKTVTHEAGPNLLEMYRERHRTEE